MKIDTPMQQLIDYATNKYGSDSNIANDIICKAMMIKKDEREEIIKSNNSGYNVRKTRENQSAQDYYNETFYTR